MDIISAEISKQIVLVVDDTPDNLAILSSLLRGRYRTMVATNGADALEIARRTEQHPDLILLDICMRGMDGYEVCRRLKADECLKNVPVIFLSALNEPMDKVKAFGLGCIDYITKPFNAEEVQARVETHLKVRRLQVELENQNRLLKDYNEQLRLSHAVNDEQFVNIAAMQTTQDQLRHTARQDPLTGLANRTAFMLAIQYGLDRKLRTPNYSFAVLFIDLDRFKSINDSMGHLVGDALFVQVAQRLLDCVRPTDFVGRLGGDEFTVLLEDVGDLCVGVDATKIASRILTDLARPFEVGGKIINTSASIGIALSSADYACPDDVIRDADTAMYKAKEDGRDCFRIADLAMHKRALKQLELEIDLRDAVDKQQFIVHYQPIVALTDGKPQGFEALVRWNHPQKGMIPPLDFIPIAEDTGLIVTIGNWVLREACTWIANVNRDRQTSEQLTINVNVSPSQLRHSQFVDLATSVLVDLKLSPGTLRLEITEGTVVEHVATVDQVLSQLKELDIELQVDDFGTGYSSLAYLHRLPIDALKIDRSFVSEMETSKESVEIIRAILALADGLGVGVVAEGVETTAQAETLREMGCNLAQGYYFAKPMTAEAAREFVARAAVV